MSCCPECTCEARDELDAVAKKLNVTVDYAFKAQPNAWDAPPCAAQPQDCVGQANESGAVVEKDKSSVRIEAEKLIAEYKGTGDGCLSSLVYALQRKRHINELLEPLIRTQQTASAIQLRRELNKRLVEIERDINWHKLPESTRLEILYNQVQELRAQVADLAPPAPSVAQVQQHELGTSPFHR